MKRRFTTLTGEPLSMRDDIGWHGEVLRWSPLVFLNIYAQRTACALLGHVWAECGNEHQPQHLFCAWCDKPGGTA